MFDPETGAHCLNGALYNITSSFSLVQQVGLRLLDLGLAPEGEYWNPRDDNGRYAYAGVVAWGTGANAAGWSNACARRGEVDTIIHALKRVAESFDLEDDA